MCSRIKQTLRHRFWFWSISLFSPFINTGNSLMSHLTLISVPFINTRNSSVSHLTTKMQKEVREDFHKILLHPRVGRGSISVVRKLMSAYHCFFPILDRNQNQNFFFVLSKKWSLMKTFWFQQQLNGISIFVLYKGTKCMNFPFIYFLFILWYLKLRWLGGISGCHGFSPCNL